MQNENVKVVLNKGCHSRKSLSGIYDACLRVKEQQTTCVEDPRLQASGMTTNLNNPPSSALTGHLPPHGEVANSNTSSTWRERVECVSTGVRGKRAFTLIELLVVVLIIGILAAVALPQYQLAVEKARMTEAIMNLKTIAKAHQLYYMSHGEYLSPKDMDLLDIQIPGRVAESQYSFGGGRIKTEYFIYSPWATDVEWLAVAYRYNSNQEADRTALIYRIYVTREEPNQIYCTCFRCNPVQDKLCNDLNK